MRWSRVRIDGGGGGGWGIEPPHLNMVETHYFMESIYLIDKKNLLNPPTSVVWRFDQLRWIRMNTSLKWEGFYTAS